MNSILTHKELTRFLLIGQLLHHITPNISGKMQPPQGQNGQGRRGCLSNSREAKPALVTDQWVREAAPLSRQHASLAPQNYVQNNRTVKDLPFYQGIVLL